MRQDLARKGLPVRLAPAVIIERASGAPEASYMSGEHTLVVHPKLFERPWRHVVDTGLWALAHVLEEVYAGRRPRTGLAPTEGMLGGDRSSWELACDRLSLRVELRSARETLSKVPGETTVDAAHATDTAALLRLERDDLKAFEAQIYPNLTSLGRGSVSLKADVFEAGKDEGERLTVHTPVGSREESGTTVRRALTS